MDKGHDILLSVGLTAVSEPSDDPAFLSFGPMNVETYTPNGGNP